MYLFYLCVSSQGSLQTFSPSAAASLASQEQLPRSPECRHGCHPLQLKVPSSFFPPVHTAKLPPILYQLHVYKPTRALQNMNHSLYILGKLPIQEKIPSH